MTNDDIRRANERKWWTSKCLNEQIKGWMNKEWIRLTNEGTRWAKEGNGWAH
jgi:hypothetical protein